MEHEKLQHIFNEIYSTLDSLQHQFHEARALLGTVLLSPSTPRSPLTGSDREREDPSQAGSSSKLSELRRHLRDLETDKRELTENMEKLLSRHRRCEVEINHAVGARDGMMKKYRLLARVAVGLLQRLTQEFPDEEFDEVTRNAVEADLRRTTPSDGSSSSSSGTARPRFEDTSVGPGALRQSPEMHGRRAGPSINSTPKMSYTSSTDTQLSAPSNGAAMNPDGLLVEWSIHTGSSCPESVTVAAGPFTQKDFVKLGIDRAELEGILYGLTHSNDVEIRVAAFSLPLRGLPEVKLVFLYEPLYLETGLRTYILDWATPSKKQFIEDWLGSSSGGDGDPIFHTFTFSRKKRHWYYLSGLRWSLSPVLDPIWPTLIEEAEFSSRATILRHLSRRSHGKLAPEVIEQQIETGYLKEVSINITPVNDEGVMEEIASRLGKGLKPMRPLPARGNQ